MIMDKPDTFLSLEVLYIVDKLIFMKRLKYELHTRFFECPYKICD